MVWFLKTRGGSGVAGGPVEAEGVAAERED